MRVFAAYQAAVATKDTEAFAALYDEHVRVFDLWGPWASDGVAARRAMAVDWLGSPGSARVLVETQDVRIFPADAVATADAFLTYRAVAADGRELRAMSNRLTWVLRLVGGAWKIVHEHTSAPVEPGTLKAILKR
ncbi:MAG: nuclear transport factor 2 family protein [Opitutae bacterium]|nr:nuclear transport factor 2 family protein [Opitutae bacterium]